MFFAQIWYYILGVLLVTIILLFGIVRRRGKIGCVGFLFGFVIFGFLILFLGNLFSLYSITQSTCKALIFGEYHKATVVDYETYISYDSEDDHNTIMYTPIVEFYDDNGKTIRQKLDFSSSSIEMGWRYSILYLTNDAHIITLGFHFILSFFTSIFFTAVFSTFLLGVFLYAINRPMDKYWNGTRKFGFYVFIPFILIGIESLLIFGLFNGNYIPFSTGAVLTFFIILVGYGIWKYYKTIISNGLPDIKKINIRKIGANRSR